MLKGTPKKIVFLMVLGAVAIGYEAFAYEYCGDEGCGLCRTKQHMHKVAPWLKMGADFRFRMIHQDARKLDRKESGHDRVWQRYRARLWGKIKHSENVDLNIGLATEPRYFFRPDLTRQFIRHEALFDRMNVEFRNIFDLPLTLKAGRQNIHLGDGWFICEGTPNDGSRTFFFDAIRLTYNLKNSDTTVDLIGIDNHANSSEWIRPFNDRDVVLAEQDERGLILHLSTMSPKGMQIDGYFIYKNDHNRNTSNGSEGNIYTLGTLIKGDLNNHWKYSLQLAPQFGHKNGKELNAFASNAKLSYHSDDAKKNTIYFGYEYFSGDDDPDKNFDRLWGRDPWWSLLYIGVDAIDGREADNSNMHRFTVGWGNKPAENVNFAAAYNLLFADDNTSAGGTNGMSKSGNFRGQLLTAMLKYKISHHLQHRINAEVMFPGDFYNNDRNDVATFLRYEIMFTW